MTNKRLVLFLCTGDICRGPMAAGYLRKLIEDAEIKSMEVRSAGVMTVPGLLATSESKQMLEAAGVEFHRHLSTPMTADLLNRSDLILGMTPLHVQQALRLAPSVRGKIWLLKEYTRGEVKKVQIEDPMGNTLEVYKKVFKEIRSACQRLVKMPFFTGKPEPDIEQLLAASRRGSAKSAAKPRPGQMKRKTVSKSVLADRRTRKESVSRVVAKAAAK